MEPSEHLANEDRLPAPWRRPFELAWEGWRAGSFPVGAVVFDEAGTPRAEGRNRMRERVAPAGQLSDTVLAHGEMNVLAQLPPGRYVDWTLYTTLEPCLLCTSALRLSRIGQVYYAAADPLWDGVAEIPSVLGERAGKYWTERHGPISGPLAAFGVVLPVFWYAEYQPDAIEAADALLPVPVVELGRRCLEHGVADAASLDEAVELAWPLLE